MMKYCCDGTSRWLDSIYKLKLRDWNQWIQTREERIVDPRLQVSLRVLIQDNLEASPRCPILCFYPESFEMPQVATSNK